MRKVATPQPLSTAWLIGCAGLCLFLSGCFAQRAELTELEQVYGGKLISLDKQNKKLQVRIGKLEETLETQDRKLRKEVIRMREFRARLNQKVVDLREEELPPIRGQVDKNAHRLESVRVRLDDMEHKTKLWLGVIEKVQSDHADLIKKDRDQFQQELQANRERFQEELRTVSETITAVAQSLDTRLEEQATSISQGEARNQALIMEQLTKLGETLSDFKAGLEKLDEKLIQEEQRINNLAAEFRERTKTLAANFEADIRAATGHLEEVNRRFDTVTKALESVKEAFTERVESQDQYLGELSKAVQVTNEQLTTIRREMASSASLRDVEHSLKALVSEQDRYVDKLAKTVEAITSQVVTLNDQMASSVQTINDRLASLTREIEGLREAQNGARANGPGMPSKDSVPEQGTKLAPAAGVATRDAAAGSTAQSDKSVYEQHVQKLKQGDL